MQLTSHEQSALDFASRIARQQGLVFDQAVMLQSSSTVVLHLKPTPVVARVAGGMTMVLRPGAKWFARELAIAHHLAAAQAPSLRPSDQLPPGPYQEQGRVLSFWQWVQELPHPPKAQEIGQGLRQCHRALASFEGDLEPWGGLREAECSWQGLVEQGLGKYLDQADLKLLETVQQVLQRHLPQTNLQPIHGDAHLLNVLNTPQGARWADWEDAFLGPVEFDLATLVAAPRIFNQDLARAEAVLRHYQEPSEQALEPLQIDAQLLDLCIIARTFLVLAWTIKAAGNLGSTLQSPRVLGRLAWLREQV
jgi:thiamine kinase-like enzyme